MSPYLIASDGGFHKQYKQYTLNIRSLPYDNLGWEKTKTWNFSVDLSFLKGRLNLVANMFKKDSDVLSSIQGCAGGEWYAKFRDFRFKDGE